jgi:endoglucanase Acf2
MHVPVPVPVPAFRYLGFSWASGIVTIGGKPYPNGRNQESASEAIAAYEAVALYGDAMVRPSA